MKEAVLEKATKVFTRHFKSLELRLLGLFDNLDEDLDGRLIKSENYQMLNTLKDKFKGRVKCCYIDPPYNTGQDEFIYEDAIKSSSWLSMLRDRVEAARLLLEDGGSFAVSIDENELAHCLRALDDIFGNENRGAIAAVKRGSVTGHKAINPGLVNVTEFLPIYARNKKSWKPEKLYRERPRNDRYNNFIVNRSEPCGKWRYLSLLDAFATHKGIAKRALRKELGLDFEGELFKFICENRDAVIQFARPDADKVSEEVREAIQKSKQTPDRIVHVPRADESDFYLLDGERLLFYADRLREVNGKWVATGSGKTLVLVKLLELLHLLMRREEIPVCDVLMLTHREDLLDQFQRTIWEYNHAPDAPMQIELRELREYPEAKRETPGGLFGHSTLRVFFYRSDNLSDEHKERIVDFRNYDNGGRWYVLLDEAHKGGSEDSKRKHIFTILSRAGFLFNFSATFTDTLDLATTVHNFNLSEFISKGYGKHIAVLKQELAAFRQRGGTGDYTDDEKGKVVAKSMLLVAYTARKVRDLRAAAGDATLYHHPMLMTLVNSVNTEDADLKLYFEQIIAIGRGDVPKAVWKEAKAELWEELKDEPRFLYEDKRAVKIAKEDMDALTFADVLRDVYNAEVAGEIEVLVRPATSRNLRSR